VHDLAVWGAHRLEGDALLLGQYIRGDLGREPGQGLGALLAVAGDVDVDPAVAGAGLALHDGPGQVLDREQGGTLGADQEAEIAAGELDVEGVLVGLGDVDSCGETEALDQTVQELRGDAALLLECNLHVSSFFRGRLVVGVVQMPEA
jgi:hypothetical protein